MGIIYYSSGHIDRALQCYREGLKYTKKGDQQYCLLLNSIGNTYISAKQFEKAIPYFEQCITYTLKNKDKKYLKSYYETLASVQILTNPDLAKKTLDIGRKVTANDSPGIDNHYTLLYSTYYLKKKDYQKAELYAKEALETSFKNNNHFQTIPAYMALSELKLAVGDYPQARIFAQKALDLGKQKGWFLSLKPITDLLLRIYKKEANNKLPFELFELHSLINDSISRNSIIEYELRNSFENKILQDSVKSANQRKIAALHYNQHIDKQRSIIWTGVGLTVLLLVLIFYIFKNYKNKQRINRIISQENVMLAEQKQEVQNHVFQLLSVENRRVISLRIQRMNFLFRMSIKPEKNCCNCRIRQHSVMIMLLFLIKKRSISFKKRFASVGKKDSIQAKPISNSSTIIHFRYCSILFVIKTKTGQSNSIL